MRNKLIINILCAFSLLFLNYTASTKTHQSHRSITLGASASDSIGFHVQPVYTAPTDNNQASSLKGISSLNNSTAKTTTDYFCGGTTYNFLNTGPEHYTYKWFVNDKLFATTYNLTLTLDYNTTYHILLLATYEGQTATAERTIKTELGPFTGPLNVTVREPLLCKPGLSTYIDIVDHGPNPNTGTVYELWKDDRLISSTRNTGSNQVMLSTPAIPETTTYDILAYRLTPCGNYSTIQSITVEVVPKPDLSLTIEPLSKYCPGGQETAIVIKKSQLGFNYILDGHTETHAGTGDDLIIPTKFNTPDASATGWIHEVRVFAIPTQCTSVSYQMENSVVLETAPLLASFEINELLLFPDQPLIFTNTSVADSYKWLIEDGSEATESIAATPPPTYFKSLGDKKITLYAYNAAGCTAVTSVVVKVVERAPVNDYLLTCNTQILSQYETSVNRHKTILASHTDKDGFVYHTGFSVNKTDYSYSTKYFNFFVEKYDAAGQLVYRREQDRFSSGNRGVIGTSLTTDADGNLYLAGVYANTFKVDDVELGHYDTSKGFIGFILKLDKLGKAQWAVSVDTKASGRAQFTDIIIGADNKLYTPLFAVTGAVVNFTNGQEQHFESELSLLEISPEGEFLKQAPILTHREEVLTSHSVKFVYGSAMVPIGPKLQTDNQNNIFVAGSVRSKKEDLLIGGHKVKTAIDAETGYIAQYNTLSGWHSTYSTYTLTGAISSLSNYIEEPNRSITKLAPDGIYTLISWPNPQNYLSPTLKVQENNYTDFAAGSCIMKYDYAGNLLWHSLLNQTSGSDLVLDTDEEKLILYGTSYTASTVTSEGKILGYKTSLSPKPFLASYNSMDGTLRWLWSDSQDTEKSLSQTAVLNSPGRLILTSQSFTPESPVTTAKTISLSDNCSQQEVTVAFTNKTICAGEQVQLNVVGGNGQYIWYPADGLNSTSIANPIAQPLTTTLYIVVTYTATGEKATRQVLVSVQQPLNPDLEISAKTNPDRSASFSLLNHHAGDSIEWNMGDGTVYKATKYKSVEAIIHTYTTDGTYKVTAKVSNSCGESLISKTVAVPCITPSAEIKYTQDGGKYTFIIDSDTLVDSLEWRFSDGTTSTARSITKALPIGWNNVELRVSNECTTVSRQISIMYCPNGPYSIEHSLTNMTAQFTAVGIPDDYILRWHFGDGTFSDEKRPVHVYKANGDYNVYLTLKNNTCFSNLSKKVTINCGPPTPVYTHVTDKKNRLQIKFAPQADTTSNKFLWNFGDGTTSQVASPTHTYRETGNYTVCVTVTGMCGYNSFCEQVLIPTALIDDPDNQLLLVYPNPANAKIFVELDSNKVNSNSELALYDIVGKQTMKLSLSGDKSKIVIDTGNLKSGIYFLKLHLSNGDYTIKRIHIVR